jgi:Sec23/Sec24 helical domain
MSGSNEREKLSVYGTDDELSLYCNLNVALTLSTAQTGTDKFGKVANDREIERNNIEEYIELSQMMANSNICVDVYFLLEDRLLSDRIRGKGKAEDLIFKDLALLSESCDNTGGKLHLISGNMRFDDNIRRLGDELEHAISLCFASESVMKLRSSKGIVTAKYCGVGVYDSLLETVELAGLSSETCMCYTVRHDRSGVIKDEDKVHFQLAVLHTDSMQRKVVRVLNLTVMASNSPATVFRHSDLDCVVAAITKLAVEKALRLPLSITANAPISGKDGTGDDVRARDWIVAISAEVLIQYRKHCSIQSPRGQLIIPEPLKLLPLYALGMLKHTAFLENVAIQKRSNTGGIPTLLSIQRLTVRASERTFELRRLKSLDIRGIISSLYPRFYSMKSPISSEISINNKSNNNINNNMNNMNNSSSSSSNGNGNNSNSKIQGMHLPSHSPTNTHTNNGSDSPVPLGTINLPPSGILGPQSLLLHLPAPLTVTSEALESDGMYLLDDGTMMWLILGKNVPLDWLECIIEGVECSLHGQEKPQKIRVLTGERSFGGYPGSVAENLEHIIRILRKIVAHKQGEFQFCFLSFF